MVNQKLLAQLFVPLGFKPLIHEAEEGGYWAEMPPIPVCATQGDSFDELLSNIYKAVEGCLSVYIQAIAISEKNKVGIAV